MGRCGNCRWFNKNYCEWWLKSVQKTTIRYVCFVPLESDTNYPLYPTLININARSFIYPEPHGRCFVCGLELKGRQRKYCSSGHRRMYYARFSWNSVRFLIWQRDKKCLECGIPLSLSKAECDHITAIALGGSFWNYDNLQTLCRACHKNKTQNDRILIQNSKINAIYVTKNDIQNELDINNSQDSFKKQKYRKKMKHMFKGYPMR